ncbi:MAG: O-methyltransferase [Chloroflexi bacterium]|nr:O-methyltransferase [Chloroflexota bacterium]MQC27065.1 O-methyltransferase [Chloroflexota bacterium]
MNFLSPQTSEYLNSLVPPRPAEMQKMEARAARDGFPIIGPACGQICYQIARMIGARRVYELGSGFGYSTAWFAMAVQENGGGEVHHTVWDETLSTQAKEHLAAMGLDEIVHYTVGEAVAAFKVTEGPFDIIFCDIDKEGYPNAVDLAYEKLRTGGVLLFDNMLWSGKILDESDQSAATQGIRETTGMLASSDKWITSVLPIRDGLSVSVKVK